MCLYSESMHCVPSPCLFEQTFAELRMILLVLFLMFLMMLMAALPVCGYRQKTCQTKLFPHATPSMKRESARGGRCGSRAAGPGGTAGRCISFDKSLPLEPGVGCGTAVSEMLSLEFGNEGTIR